MYQMDICYKYSNVISHLRYATKEAAEAERDKLQPLMGDKWIVKNEKTNLTHIIADDFGTNLVVCESVISIRIFEIKPWQEIALSDRDVALAREIADRIALREAGVENVK